MSLLIGTPDNPVPEGCISGAIPAPGGGHLRHARLPGRTQDCKGTIVCLHGRNESIEKYFETMDDLAEAGHDVVTFDWRGQGGSSRYLKDRSRGFVDTFHQYADDLDAILEWVALRESRPPYHILAHSTGGLAALFSAPRLAGRIRRMVLVAPLLELANLPMAPATAIRVARFLDAIGLSRMYMAGGPRPPEGRPFEGNVLTSDPGRYRRNSRIIDAAPELGLGGPTVGWLRAAVDAMQTVRDEAFMAAIRIPVLVIAAGADRIVSTPAIERHVARMRSATMVTVDGARHEILQEQDRYREQALAAILAFLPGSPDIG